MTTLYFCFIAFVSFAFLVAVFKFNKYKPEDAAAMKRAFGERMKTIETLKTPEQFEVLKQHINDDAMRFRLVVSPDLVNVKVAWLFAEIEKRTDEMFKPAVEDWLYNYPLEAFS